MPNTELPMDLESQVVLMKKYITFRQRKKMREFLGYAGYFRASRYGKFLLTQVNAFGSKANSKVFFELYDFDVQLRLLLFKYCKKAEVRFKSAIANAVSLKTGDAGFYLDRQYYTPTKSEKDKKTRNRNITFFNTKFFANLTNDEEKLRRDVVKHPELREYRKGGTRQNNVLPVWAAFSYFEMGTIVMIYSYLRGDLRKEVLASGVCEILTFSSIIFLSTSSVSSPDHSFFNSRTFNIADIPLSASPLRFTYLLSPMIKDKTTEITIKINISVTLLPFFEKTFFIS